MLITVHIDRGEYDAAARCAARFDLSKHAGSALLAPWHAALGRLAIVERRESDALVHYARWRDAAAGVRNPAAFAGWRSAFARALTALDRADEARELAAEELELARGFGAPRAISVALRELARAGAPGEIEASIAMLTEAVEISGGSEARLEHCRALLDLGTVLRRAGRRTEAGRALGEALELARDCGARLLQDRAQSELEVAGARVQRAARRGADALSPSERRVVALAIDGLSNRQIAEALFVTRKAVEWHLGNAYRKLDVRSRGELAGALGVLDGAGVRALLRRWAQVTRGGGAAGGDVVDEAAGVVGQPAVGVDELLREILDRGQLVVGVAVEQQRVRRRADDLHLGWEELGGPLVGEHLHDPAVGLGAFAVHAERLVDRRRAPCQRACSASIPTAIASTSRRSTARALSALMSIR